ncbi:RidA family protein [Arthrobacter sp. Br18]|uniref:RidA family protein n=1 Tax=Arthrobacter sp. Br18 TaxID=1312954 RepID=UPI000479E8FC|nr:RidA family protein [Arthrobacter sp. Br18]
MNSSRFLHPPTLAATDYAYAAVVPASSRLLFLAGACPLDPDGTVPAAGFADQARRAMVNLDVALTAGGAGLDDVVSIRVLIASADQRHLVEAWDVVRAAFGAHSPPSTLLGVTVLGYPGQLVEVEAVAAVAGAEPGAS